jgi:transposase InsO family protein
MVPRVHAALQALGRQHGRKRIRTIDAHRRARRRQPPLWRGDHDAKGKVGPARAGSGRPQLQRNKAEPALVADISFVPTAAGFLYLAVVLDTSSRKIVGWSMANHLCEELAPDVLEMATGQRRPRNVIHHSAQDGFKWSSQQPYGGSCTGRSKAAVEVGRNSMVQSGKRGAAEGHNTRPRLVKRRMYCRAKLNLLRARLLGAF